MTRKTAGLIFVITLALASCPAQSDRERDFFVGRLVINEVLYNLPRGRDLEEWVELYNNSAQTINLRGWAIDDLDTHRLEFAEDVFVPPGGYVLVVTNAEHVQLLTDEPDFAVAAYQTAAGRPWNLQIWNNDGDEIVLTDPSGRIVDYIAFGNPQGRGRDPQPAQAVWEGNIPNAPPGYSLALFPNGYDMNSSRNWSFRPPDHITPGSRNK